MSQKEDAAFVQARRSGDSPHFTIRAVAPHTGDRFVIPDVAPLARNREAIGREAELRATATADATLTAAITPVQASINKPGGLLLPFRRLGDESAGEPVGGSCAPLRIDDILRGLDVEEQHFALSPHDLAQSPINAFFSTGKDRPLALTARCQACQACQACQEPLPGPVEPRSAPP